MNPYASSNQTVEVCNKHKYYKPWHLTPASSEWLLVQLTMGLWGHSVSLLSLPPQSTSSRWMGPVPAPKWAFPNGTGSVNV